jgi:hypothetical protein
VNRREVLQTLYGVLGVAGTLTFAQEQNAFAQETCGAPRHLESTFTGRINSLCSSQIIQVTLTNKVSVQTCTNADGSTTVRVHGLEHGTAQGFDPNTGQQTNYVLNEQVHEYIVTGGPSSGCTPFSFTDMRHLLLISQGSAPNEKTVETFIFSIDGACNFNFKSSVDTDCQG